MSDALSEKGQFNPIYAAHAIEQVSFNLQFDQPLEDSFFSEVRKAAQQFKPELPGEVETQGLAFMLVSSAATPPAQTGGVMFRRVGPDGTVENELRVDRNSVTFRTTIYSRWNTVWEQANKYLKELAPIYAAHARISGITIHYVDKFAWAGELTKCMPTHLLRAESQYLCPHVYKAGDFWHSHTGAFIRADNSTKRLLNVNVDYLDENRLGGVNRIVAITTVLTDLLNQSGYESCAEDGNNIIGLVDAHMQRLHVFGKEVLSNIINDEMCRRIALTE